jgi:hypothetical protein
MLATPSRCESLLRWVDYARPHSAVNAVLHYFYFRRKNPPATVCWRVRAKMSCNAMQRGIEWRMDKIKDAIQSLRRTLSQSEIARRTGIAQHKISRWESGGIPAWAH